MVNLRYSTVVLGDVCASLLPCFGNKEARLADSVDRDLYLEALARRVWSFLVSVHPLTACIAPQLSCRWEFFTTLDYEWRVFRGHLPYRWTIWVSDQSRFYFLCYLV